MEGNSVKKHNFSNYDRNGVIVQKKCKNYAKIVMVGSYDTVYKKIAIRRE